MKLVRNQDPLDTPLAILPSLLKPKSLTRIYPVRPIVTHPIPHKLRHLVPSTALTHHRPPTNPLQNTPLVRIRHPPPRSPPIPPGHASVPHQPTRHPPALMRQHVELRAHKTNMRRQPAIPTTARKGRAEQRIAQVMPVWHVAPHIRLIRRRQRIRPGVAWERQRGLVRPVGHLVCHGPLEVQIPGHAHHRGRRRRAPLHARQLAQSQREVAACIEAEERDPAVAAAGAAVDGQAFVA